MPDFLYSDVNFETGERTKSELVLDDPDIQQSIVTILTTRRGSRLFRPTFGCEIERVLFDPINESNRLKIVSEIKNALTKWETRVKLVKTSVLITFDLPGYVCSIEYSIPLLGITNNLNFALKSRL